MDVLAYGAALLAITFLSALIARAMRSPFAPVSDNTETFRIGDELWHREFEAGDPTDPDDPGVAVYRKVVTLHEAAGFVITENALGDGVTIEPPQVGF